jgi:hypothetical protein
MTPTNRKEAESMNRSNQEILLAFKEAKINAEVEWLKIELLLDIRSLLNNIYGGQVSLVEVQRDFADRANPILDGLTNIAGITDLLALSEGDKDASSVSTIADRHLFRGIELDDGQPAPPGAPVIELPSEPISCQSCGRVNNPPGQYCSGCGLPLKPINVAPNSALPGA